LIHDLILTPVYTMKQRMQIAPSHLKEYKTLLKLTYRNEGFQAFYRSYPLTAFMNVPNAAILVGVNETLKHNYKPEKGHTISSYILCAFVAGASASMFTAPLDNIKTRLQTGNFIKYLNALEVQESAARLLKEKEYKESVRSPRTSISTLKVMKDARPLSSRPFSTMPPEANPASSILKEKIAPFKVRDALKIAKMIYAEGGIRGLYKGALPRVITTAPASAISWTTYELMKGWLSKKDSRN